MRNSRIASIGAMLWMAMAIVLSLAYPSIASAGQTVRVSKDLELYYEEAGRGTPIVFIPLWTGTTALYTRQLDHFSKRHRAIAYDPRGQGRSSKTLDGHNYLQHGADLATFMAALKLENVVLVGHSYGCHTAYAYFRLHGTGKVKAFVCIDSPPKPIVDKDGDWGFIKHPNDMKAFEPGLHHDRLKTTQDFVQSMVTRPLAEKERDTLVAEMLRTPTYVALLLDYDGQLADFSEDAKALDGKIPVLHVLADPGWFDGWTTMAKTWLVKNAPNSKTIAFGLHMMQWEFPDRFNAAVDEFLAPSK